jgi:hypothetical protein
MIIKWFKDSLLLGIVAHPGISLLIFGIVLPFLFIAVSNGVCIAIGVMGSNDPLLPWIWIPAVIMVVMSFVLMIIIYSTREKYATIAEEKCTLIKMLPNGKVEEVGSVAFWGSENDGLIFRVYRKHSFPRNVFKVTSNILQQQKLSVISVPVTFTITIKELLEKEDWEQVVRAMKFYEVNNFFSLFEKKASRQLELFERQNSAEIKKFQNKTTAKEVLQENILQIIQKGEDSGFDYSFVTEASVVVDDPVFIAILNIKK